VRVIVVSIDGFAGFYWRDPRARLPALRRLAERGAVSARMEAVTPSTTWPTHVSLMTGVRPGRHGVAGNHVLNRATLCVEDLTGDPIHDAEALIRVPTLYDRAHAAGRRTAAIDWPATRRARSLDFNLPFFKDQGVFERHTAPGVWRQLAEWGYPVERQGEWAQLPRRFLKDGMVCDLASRVWASHEPDLLLVHFLCTDSLQHLHGPRSPEAYWALEYVDERVGRLLERLPAGALDRDTAVFVVSDHGFLPVSHEVRVNVWLRRQGLLEVNGQGAIGRAEARLVMNHGSGYLYLLGGGDRDRLARDLAGPLAALEGVAGVWTADQYAGLGLPAPGDNGQVGEMLLEAAPGYCFGDDPAGEGLLAPPRYRGTHGQRPSYADNEAFFLAAGPGIARGLELGPIASRDVAPTAAAVLGLDMGDVEGRVLAEILTGGD
jgi:predicted AlkP superfamily pyrophosphatase or phosphodiesterase